MLKIKDKITNKCFDMVNNITKTKAVLIILTLIFILILTLILYNSVVDDGMNNNRIKNIYYKTSSSEKKWNRWKKNGITSGDKKSDIKKINIKLGLLNNSNLSYCVYNGKKWICDKDINTELKQREDNRITGLKIKLLKDLDKKYEVCYRTYNKINRWMPWSCNGKVNGTRYQNMKALEIKIIPKGIIKEDYLKDYDFGYFIQKDF